MRETYLVKFWILQDFKRALGQVHIDTNMPFVKIAPTMPTIIADSVKRSVDDLFNKTDISEKNIVIVEIHNLTVKKGISLDITNSKNLSMFCKIVNDMREGKM